MKTKVALALLLGSCFSLQAMDQNNNAYPGQYPNWPEGSYLVPLPFPLATEANKEMLSKQVSGLQQVIIVLSKRLYKVEQAQKTILEKLNELAHKDESEKNK